MSKSIEEIAKASDQTFFIPNPFNFTLNFFLTWGPVIDGFQVPSDPLTALENYEKGEYVANVPIMMGNNQNEGVMFVYQAATSSLPYAEYVAGIFGLFRSAAIQVLEFYPITSFNSSHDYRPLLSELLTDYLFSCPTRYFAKLWNQNIQTQVYLYHYDHVLSFSQTWGPRYWYCVDQCCHGSELPFVFHTADQGGFNFTAQEELLSRGMVNYWTNFAHTSNPNQGPNSPSVQWLSFDSKLSYIHLKTPISQETGYNQQACDLWDSLGYGF